jgi:hypothetical protein
MLRHSALFDGRKGACSSQNKLRVIVTFLKPAQACLINKDINCIKPWQLRIDLFKNWNKLKSLIQSLRLDIKNLLNGVSTKPLKLLALTEAQGLTFKWMGEKHGKTKE